MVKLRDSGDTIVEVMFAIAIVSSVLGVSYTTVSRATNNARQAQERGVATKLLESQVERLKAKASEPSSVIFSGASTFCLDQTNTKSDFLGAIPSTPDTDT